MSRRIVLKSLALTAAGVTGVSGLQAPTALAQPKFPDRPVKVLVGFPAGGSTDTVMRVLAQAASKHLGQQVVIENRPGASGAISITMTKAAPPDGHTLGLFTLSVFRSPVQTDAGYDPMKDLTYIIRVTNVVFGVVVPATAPWKTWRELLDYGRANPGKITFGVPAGLGNSAHLVMAEVMGFEKLDWTVVPYKGSADTAQALLGGQVSFTVDGSGGFAGLVESGKARLLAVATDDRSVRWPDVPTLRELGYDTSVDSPWGLGGPAGMDRNVIATLHDAFRKALDEPAVRESIARQGQAVRYMGPQDYTAWAAKEYQYQRALLTKYGFAKKD